jgi:hypothetical protein
VKLFAVMRQRNVIVGICVPNFYTLDSYVRDHRVDTLIHIKSRGQYRCITGQGIKIVSKEGAKYKDINAAKIPYEYFFDGYFTKKFPEMNDITEESYKLGKGDHFNEFLEEMGGEVKTEEKVKFITIKQAMKIAPLSYETYIRHIVSGKIKAKKMGSQWMIRREEITG